MYNIQTRAAVARCYQVWCLTSRRGAEGSEQIVTSLLYSGLQSNLVHNIATTGRSKETKATVSLV